MTPEEPGQIGLVGESQLLGDLRHREVGIAQQHLDLGQPLLVDELLGCPAALTLSVTS